MNNKTNKKQNSNSLDRIWEPLDEIVLNLVSLKSNILIKNFQNQFYSQEVEIGAKPLSRVKANLLFYL